MKRPYLIILSTFLFVFSVLNVFATHLRGGYIEIQRTSTTGTSCQITIYVWTKTTGPSDVLFGGDEAYIDFGDGTTEPVPYYHYQPSDIRLDLDPEGHIATARFTTVHNYSGYGKYIVSYMEANRNEGILNMNNSVNTTFYIESLVDLYPAVSFSSTPFFLNPPIFYAKYDDDLSFSAGAIDPNNTLYYELVPPMQDRNKPVINYKLPTNFKINEFSGLVTWDTQFLGYSHVGEYTFAVKVSQYKNGKVIGYVIRDQQLIIEDVNAQINVSDNQNLDENNRIFIAEGEQSSVIIIAEATNSSNVELSLASALDETFASLTTYDSVSESKKIKVGILTLKSSAAIIRDNPYVIAVRASCIGDIKLNKDLSYLFYTKDIELEPLPSPNPVTAVGSVFETNLVLYPNPVSDRIFIQNNKGISSPLKIFDLDGHLVLEEKNFKGQVLDVSQLKSGVYFMKLENSAHAFRFIKD